MDNDRVLVFDLWGDYGHFRKIETTTSPLTYSIPTGTALSGLVSAILGYPRDSYYDLFSPNKIKFAVRILNPIKKVRINLALINTKYEPFFALAGKKNPRTLIPYEFLKDPKYRIFIGIRDSEIREKLRDI